MPVLDVLLLFLIYGSCLIVCFLFHYLASRFFSPKGFFSFLIAVNLLSVAAVSVLAHFLAARFFSSFEAYCLSNLGAGLAAFFTCNYYAIIGPITADRSLTAHLLVFLSRFPEGLERGQIVRQYDASAFLEKRYEECARAGIIRDVGGRMTLTAKGRRIAGIYVFLMRLLRLSRKPHFRDYFAAR